MIHRENPIFEHPGVSTVALKTIEVFSTHYKMTASDFEENSVVEDDDIPMVPGGGQVDCLIELFAAQEQLWFYRGLLYHKMKDHRGAVCREMAVTVLVRLRY